MNLYNNPTERYSQKCRKITFHGFTSLANFVKNQPKGQIKSEWIYEIINFPKNEPTNVKDFCPINCHGYIDNAFKYLTSYSPQGRRNV